MDRLPDWKSRLLLLAALTVVLVGVEVALGASCLCAYPGEDAGATCVADGCADEPAPAPSPCCPHGCDRDCLRPCCSGVALAPFAPAILSHESRSTVLSEPASVTLPAQPVHAIFHPPRV